MVGALSFVYHAGNKPFLWSCYTAGREADNGGVHAPVMPGPCFWGFRVWCSDSQTGKLSVTCQDTKVEQNRRYQHELPIVCYKRYMWFFLGVLGGKKLKKQPDRRTGPAIHG